MSSPGLLLILLFLLPAVSCLPDLASAYQFNVTLVPDRYWLYWNFNTTAQNINFAVRVQTTGWIGFGLSPDGRMLRSDVVIGWIDGSNSYFSDRSVTGYFTPPVDPVQNWFLSNAEQEGGYTVLEFYRNFISCDNNDISIPFEPTPIIYSWSDTDPGITHHSGGGISFSFNRHDNRGSAIIDFLSRFSGPTPPVPGGTQTLFVGVVNANIPRMDSTANVYWCRAHRLPGNVLDSAHYITKFSVRLTSGNEQHVSDMIVHLCDNLENEDLVPAGMLCHEVSSRTASCLSQHVIGGWGRGGGEFIYPEHVAYKFGGRGNDRYIVIQINYVNPTGFSDSSGIVFTYTSTPRQYNAGILYFGHRITRTMVIPPGSPDFTVVGLCSGTCTENNFPPNGIRIIANLFYSGHEADSLEISHINKTDCSRGNILYNELEPVERNRFYDRDKEGTTFLQQEVHVQPGDTLLLKCSYNTSQQNRVTLGGFFSHEEVCLSFPVYYPRTDMIACASYANFSHFDQFIDEFVPENDQPAFRSLILNPLNPLTNSSTEISNAMNRLQWTQAQRDGYQRLIYTEGKQWSMCHFDYSMGFTNATPNASCCGYQPDNVCTGETAIPCCQRQCALQGAVGTSIMPLGFILYLTLVIITVLS